MIFRKRFRSFVIGMIPVVAGFSINAHAQMSGLEMYPQLRQGTGSAASQLSSGVDVPSISENGGMGAGLFQLPQGRQSDFNGQYEILLDRRIDRDEYIVGPGDYLSVYLWGELDQEYASRVTPDGEVIIPTVGAVMVSDVTLSEAGDRIRDAARRTYTNLDVTINLLSPRRFRLFVTGQVERPNMYEANSLMRVSDLLLELDTSLFPPRSETVQEQQLLKPPQQAESNPAMAIQPERITDYELPSDLVEGRKAGLFKRSDDIRHNAKKASSKRTIMIYRGDEQIPVDLLRFEKLGDIDVNPYVSGGDRIFVPGYLGDMFAEGEIIAPGIYEFKPGDTVRDLVGFSGGLTAVADSTATLVRFGPDGHEQVNIMIDLHDALVINPGRSEYLLQESDRLFVRAKYNYKELANVRVQGEVRFPGYYAITDNVTRLTDIIAMAGGFTDEADLEGAQIIKDPASIPYDPEYQRLSLMQADEMNDQEYEFYKVRARTPQNMIAVDFAKLFRNDDQSQNIILDDGDTIIIPAAKDMIHVVGAVEVPGYMRIEPGADYLYYIEKAGGYNWNAKTRDMRIIKAKSGQQFKPKKDVVIESGDTIFVPEKRPKTYWALAQQSIQLLANIATVILIIDNVSKN